MFDKPQVMIVMAIALVAGAFAGCGGSSPAAALKDPGVRGVDALRQAVRAALLNHDARSQCELFAPSLIEAHGGSTDTCAAWLHTESGPYKRNPKMYLGGGHIEIVGNQASYELPPYSFPAEEAPSSGLGIPEPLTVFTASYTEGQWRIVENDE